jgi:hypothetical protein
VADQSASLDVGFFGDGDDDEKVTTFDLLDSAMATCRDRDGQVLQRLSTAASRGSGPQRYTRPLRLGRSEDAVEVQ